MAEENIGTALVVGAGAIVIGVIAANLILDRAREIRNDTSTEQEHRFIKMRPLEYFRGSGESKAQKQYRRDIDHFLTASD